MNESKAQKDGSWIIRVLKGLIISIGAALPGISGGALCLIVGVYRPMMDFLANPIREFKNKFWFFLPIVFGAGVGFVGASKVLGAFLETYEIQATWLFIGLVAGTLPSLFHEVGLQGRTYSAWTAFGISLCVNLTWMLVLRFTGGTEINPNIIWWAICGMLWGLGMIIPGMSPSNIFLFFGLTAPMYAGIGMLDMGIILPMIAALAATILLLGGGMKRLLDKHYAVTMHAILGMVVASTISIIPTGGLHSLGNIAVYALLFCVGAGVAYLIARIEKPEEQ